MRVIPVIDLKHGIAVHAVGGNREQYVPVRSRLANSADPPAIAAAFAQLGLREVYVADLDAIAGGPLQPELYASISQAGLALLLDAGLCDPERAADLLTMRATVPLDGLVAGLESLASLESLAEILKAVGPERLIFSVDLKHGRPCTSSPSWGDQSALEIARAACAVGIRRFIVLDLADVGSGQGTSTLPLCQQLRATARTRGIEIVAGGGVRSAADLRTLAEAGCDGALVATALHNGSITREDLALLASCSGR